MRNLPSNLIIRRLFRFSGLFWLALIVAGCCSVVTKSGDARILKCPQFIHSPGIESYRMVLPSISLAQPGTNILHIRDLPTYLVGRYSYDLFIPYDGNSAKNVPWKNARITIAFQKLNHAEFYKKTLILHTDPPGAPDTSNRWSVGSIYSEDCSTSDSSYDIVVTIEQPSQKSSDRISLIGYAFAHKP
jgi:hypothetical protein